MQPEMFPPFDPDKWLLDVTNAASGKWVCLRQTSTSVMMVACCCPGAGHLFIRTVAMPHRLVSGKALSFSCGECDSTDVYTEGNIHEWQA